VPQGNIRQATPPSTLRLWTTVTACNRAMATCRTSVAVDARVSRPGTSNSNRSNVKVEFVKTDKDIFDRVSQNGDEKPSLIIFDLNNLNAKPLTTIPKLKAKLKKETTIIGFVSHVQGELKLKAQEAGCDVVIPRSAFSQNLPQLLRRHGAPEELDETV
jgi:hypothetical protein